MSNWQDTYKKLKKRKEEMNKISGSLDASYNTATPSVKDINGLRNPDSAYNTLDVSSVLLGAYSNKVQPTVTKDEDKKWYQKFFKGSDAFKDGYQAGDITKTVLGTVSDIENSVAKGVVSIAEAPIDIASYAAYGILDKVGADKAAQKVKKFAQRDLSQEAADKYTEKASIVTKGYNSVSNVQNKYLEAESLIKEGKTKEAKETLKDLLKSSGKSFLGMLVNQQVLDIGEKAGLDLDGIDDPDKLIKDIHSNSVSGDTLDKTAELVGYVLSLGGATKAITTAGTKTLGNVTTNAAGKTIGSGLSLNGGNIGVTIAGKTLNLPTLALTGGTSSGLNEAYQKEGVTHAQAWTKGLTSGVIEGITEGIFGVLGVGGNEVTDKWASDLAKKASTSLGKQLANITVKGGGESLEEATSYIANWLLDNHVIDKMKGADFKSDFDVDDLAEQMALAFISTGATQGSSTALQVNNEVNDIISQKETELGRNLTKVEKSAIRSEAAQKIIDVENNQSREDIVPVNARVQEVENQLNTNRQQEVLNQVEQQDIAPFKTSNITTQETNSNSFVEAPNNTINNEKPITSKTNIKDYIGIEDYNTKGGENKISDGLIREIQYKTRKANENKSNIEIVSTNDISKNEKNGGYRTSEQINKLTNDIKNEGILEPIEVKRNSDGSVEVVNGNHRLEIAKQLGLKEVPVKYVNSDIENIDNSQNILYNKENKKDLNYINEDYKNGIRNNKETIKNNDRSGNIQEYSISNSVEAENEGTAGKNDKISNKISRYNDGSSSTSTYAQNTGIKELDNSSFSFNERYDDLKKITKEFNKVKSEISGIKEDLAPIKGYMKQETSLYDQANFDNLEKQGIAPVKESSNPNYNSWEELMLDLYKPKNQKEKEAITSQKTSNETKMSGTEDIAPVKQPTLKVDPEMNVAFDKFAQSFIDKQNELKERKKTKPKIETKTKLGRAWDTFQETMINRNRQIDNLAKETGNSEIKFKGDRMNNISGEIGGDIFTAQTDNYGNAIGKSLDAPFAEARNLGIDAYFDGYLKNLSNVERHEQGKGSSVVSAEQSKTLIKAYEERYPVLKNLANDVYTYNQNMLNNAVENGIIDNEFRDRLISTYGKYVPFYENDIGTNPGMNMSPDEIRGSKPIKRAKGGSDANLQGVEQAMMKQTYAWKNAIVKNDLYKEIVNSINDKVNIGADTRENPTLLSDSLYSDENGKYLTAYVDGKQQTVKIGDELFSELNRDLDKQIRNYEEKLSLVTKPLQKLSQIRGQILTTYNPSFVITNPFKDIQDALLNTKNLKGYAKNLTATIQDSKRAKNINTYANDYKTITGQDITSVTDPSSLTGTAKKLYKKYQDGVMWNRFITSYGTNATSMEYGNNNVDTKTKNKGFLNKIANANDYMEVMFRYPEFKAALKEGKSFTEALYNAREITANFGRGGTISKAINRNGATFFNASIQGLDKFVRNFSGENGARGFVGAVSKAVMLGMAPSVLNHLLLGGLGGDADDDYEALPDYVKDNYYVFKKDNGEFARIPKGRMISVLGSAARRTLELAQGEKNAFDGFLSNAESQVGSTNPLKENIFSPLIQAYGSENGEAWYGGDLVPSRLQDLPVAEQYDESTDELSKLIGNVFNISPYKVNYVIDQYSGGLGDILLPMASKKAFNDSDSFGDYLLAPIKDKFLVNSTDDNKYAGELFDMSDELTTKANSSKATDEDKLKNQYINSVKSDMSKLYQEKREIQNSNLSKSEKYKQVQKIQDQINQMSKDALNTYEKGKYESNYASFGDTEFYKYKNSEGEEFWKQIKDDETDDLNSMELTASEKNKYFISKTKIGDIAGVYKESKKGLDEDDNSYNEAIAEISDDKKESIIDTILKADLPDEAKEYLYSKNYSSEKSLDKITKAGTSINTYLTFEKDTLKFEADKDDDGKKISGSLNNKYEKYLLNSKLSDTDKINLYEHAVLSGFNEEDKYKDYKTIKAAGVDIDTWLGFDSHAFEADKDKNGKAVSGSKKKKVISYVNSLDLSIPQKAMMIKTKYSSFHNYNNQIVKFVEGLDVSFNDKVKMIKSLNMKVSNDGTVSW